MTTTTTRQALPPTTQDLQRRRRLFGGILIFLVLIVVAFVGLMMWRMNYVPTDLNTATTQTSEQGLFRATYTPNLDPLQINQIHSWTLHVTNPDGESLAGAQINVDGGMPQHGHGLPTAPQVTADLGQGDYLVEGLKFHMPGWWVVKFHITANGQTDTVTFNMILR